MYCNFLVFKNEVFFIQNYRNIIISFLVFLVVTINCSAQQSSKTQKKSVLDLQIFANTGFTAKSSKQLDFDYNIKRTLLIYKQQITDEFNFCLAADTYVKDSNGKPYNLTPYLKRAYIQYYNNNLSISVGLLVLEQFKSQRKIWKLRYIDKTFQNKFKYGENRNIGVMMKHDLTRVFSYDFAFTTGYSTPSESNSEKYTVMMGQTLATGFANFRLFNRITVDPNYEQIVSLFIYKKLPKTNLGIESAVKFSNHKLENEDMYGFSIFGNYLFSKNSMLFGRLDINKEIEKKTENVIYAGIEYSFQKYIKGSIFLKNVLLDKGYYGIGLFIHVN